MLYEGPQDLGAYMRKEDLHFVPRLSSTTLRELIAQLQDAQAPTNTSNTKSMSKASFSI